MTLLVKQHKVNLKLFCWTLIKTFLKNPLLPAPHLWEFAVFLDPPAVIMFCIHLFSSWSKMTHSCKRSEMKTFLPSCPACCMVFRTSYWHFLMQKFSSDASSISQIKCALLEIWENQFYGLFSGETWTCCFNTERGEGSVACSTFRHSECRSVSQQGLDGCVWNSLNFDL